MQESETSVLRESAVNQLSIFKRKFLGKCMGLSMIEGNGEWDQIRSYVTFMELRILSQILTQLGSYKQAMFKKR